jgi:predicted lipoprotein with Yx(FWY)xxD motif
MRVDLRRAAPALILGLGLLAVACGAATSSGQSHRPAAKASPAVNSIGTTTAVVGGQSRTILTDSKGRTLYLFAPEKDGKVATTPALLKVWPALLLPDATAAPTANAGLPGKLGAVTRPDGGRQVTYNEWPLYTYVGDGKPGDTTGDGIGNQWFVVQSVMPADADNDADGTTAPAVAAQPTPTPAVAPSAAAPAAPPATAPSFNDGDADNNGGPNDGDGRG